MKKNIVIVSMIIILILCIVGMLNIKNNSNIDTTKSKDNNIKDSLNDDTVKINKDSNADKNSKTDEKNNDNDITRDTTYKNLSITDISIKIDKQNRSTYTATITNLEDTNSIERLNIIFKDKGGSEIDILTGFIGLDLKKGEQVIISSFTDLDLSKAASIEYQEGN